MSFKKLKIKRPIYNDGKGWIQGSTENKRTGENIVTVVDERDGYWILEDGKRAKINKRNIVEIDGKPVQKREVSEEEQNLWNDYHKVVKDPSLQPDDKETQRKAILKKINDVKRGDKKPVSPEVKKLWDEFHKIKKNPDLTDEQKREQSSIVVGKINAIKYPKKSNKEIVSNVETQDAKNIDVSQFSVPQTENKEKEKVEKPKGKSLDI